MPVIYKEAKNIEKTDLQLNRIKTVEPIQLKPQKLDKPTHIEPFKQSEQFELSNHNEQSKQRRKIESITKRIYSAKALKKLADLIKTSENAQPSEPIPTPLSPPPAPTPIPLPEAKLYKKIYDKQSGKLKAIYQWIEPIEPKSKRFRSIKMPIGAPIVLSLLYILVLLVIVGALITTFFIPRPAFYKEDCSKRPCLKTLNMTCIKGQCLCTNDQFYMKKCKAKLNYSEKCYGNSNYCIDNVGLRCTDGACKCDENLSYWNGTICANKQTYAGSCYNDSNCLTNKLLICNLNLKQCLCEVNRYDMYI